MYVFTSDVRYSYATSQRKPRCVCQTFPSPPYLQIVVDALTGLVLNVREKNSTMQFTF